MLTVRDDGTGFAPGSRNGVGTQAMVERADEQGGVVEIVSGPGAGTVVRALLPLIPDHVGSAPTHG